MEKKELFARVVVCSGELDPEQVVAVCGGAVTYGGSIDNPLQLLDAATTALSKAEFFNKLVDLEVVACANDCTPGRVAECRTNIAKACEYCTQYQATLRALDRLLTKK